MIALLSVIAQQYSFNTFISLLLYYHKEIFDALLKNFCNFHFFFLENYVTPKMCEFKLC